MASIRERKGEKGTTYQVLYRHNGTQRSEAVGADREYAEWLVALIERIGVERAIAEHKRRTGIIADASETATVHQYLHHHIERLTGVTKGTKKTYRIMAEQIAKYKLGSLPINAVIKQDVEDWVKEQESEKNPPAPKTIRNRQGLLFAAFARAVDDGVLVKNPAKAVKITRKERKQMVFLTPTEFNDALLPIISPHYQPFFMLLFGTGLRFGEAIALRPQDFNLATHPPTLTVSRAWQHGGGWGPPKTERANRTISIPTAVVDAVRPLVTRAKTNELVFTNNRGARISENTMWENWERWRKLANDADRCAERSVKPLGKIPRMHDLRHSHASHMLSTGMNMFDLQHRLGHESIKTTADRYGHLMPEAQIQALKAANLAFEPESAAVAGEVDDTALIEQKAQEMAQKMIAEMMASFMPKQVGS